MAGAAYCDVEDLGRLGVNAEALEGVPSTDGQLPQILSASRKIDSYLRERFSLPLVSFGDDIRECCAVLAAWAILRTRGIKPGENHEDNALYLERNTQIKWLERIAQGLAVPDVVGAPPPPVAVVSTFSPRVRSNEGRQYQTDDGGRGSAFTGRSRR